MNKDEMVEKMVSNFGHWYEDSEIHTVYACPVCGILQIEV